VFLGLLAATILESTVWPVFGFSGGVPDLVLVLVVSWGLVRGREEGMVWGMLGGLSVGLLSGGPLGAHSLMMTMIGFAAGLGQRSPFRSRLLVPLVSIALGTLAYDAGLALVLRLSGWPMAINPIVLRVVAPAIVANGVLMLLVYGLISYLFDTRAGMRPEFSFPG
jgi:rod shape-determining protein MreD